MIKKIRGSKAKFQFWGIVSLVSVLISELLLDNIIITEPNLISIKTFLLLGIGVIFFISIYVNWKNIVPQNEKNRGEKIPDVLKNLIKNSVSGNTLDLLFVLFFLLHLTWVPDSIFEFVKNDPPLDRFWCRLLRPAIYICGLLIIILIKPQAKKDSTPLAKVMLTGISNISITNIFPLLKPLEENKLLEKIIVFADKKMSVDRDLLRNWEQPEGYNKEKIIQEKNALIHYGVGKETLECISAFEDYEQSEQLLKDFLQKLFHSMPGYIDKEGKPEVIVVPCNYLNLEDLNYTVSKTTKEVLLRMCDNEADTIKCYSDKNLLFNLTPGTKHVSIALALNSIKGERQYCYVDQNSKKLQISQLDVFDFKDIIDEMLN